MLFLGSKLHRTLTLSLFAIAGVAWAQDTPPADPTPAEPPTEATPAEEAPEKVTRNEIVIGYSNWVVRNNFQKWQQYGVPTRGIAVRKLDLLFPKNGSSPFVKFTFSGEPGREQEGGGEVIFDQGRGRAKFNLSQHYSHDISPVLTPRSTRRSYNVDIDYALTHDIGVYWQTRQETQDKYRVAPADEIRVITKSFAGGLQGKLGGGNFGVEIGDRRYYDRTLTQPKTVQRRYSADYTHPIGETANVGAAWSHTRIEQPSRNVGDIQNASFNADWDFSPTGTLFLVLKRDNFKLPPVENVTDRKRLSSSIRLVQHLPIGNLELGYQSRSNERFRADHSYVDVPKWDTYDARLTGTFMRGLRYSLKGSYEHLHRQPGFQTEEDSRGLYFDDRIRFSGMISGGNEKFNGYLAYQFRYDENSPREIQIRTHLWTLGASYVFNDRTSGYFELLNETAEAKGLIEDGLNLDSFFPSWTSLAFGVDHTVNAKDSMSLAINHYFANNANPMFEYGGNVRGTELTAQYHHQISSTESLHVLLAPWRYDDKVDSSARYRATVLGVSFALKF